MWKRIFARRNRNAELEEELQAHIDIEARRLAGEGLSREQAAAEARRTFGSRALISELTRESWGTAWRTALAQDLRYAARALRRSPGFTAAAVLSLALGIAASTVVFSVADTVYLRPLPYRAPQELMFIAVRIFKLDFVPSPDYVAWRRDNAAFQEMAAMQYSGGQPATLSSQNPIEVHTTRVSHNFLTALGVSMALGRNFQPQEELPNGPRAAILTDSLWRNHFHAARDIAGRTIVLDGVSHTVAGVLPPSFVMPMGAPADVLLTLPVSPTASHRDKSMSTWTVFARLKPGVTMAQAKANLETLFSVSKAEAPQMFRNDTWVVIESLQKRMAGNAHTLVLVLAGAVGCLLLIACANVANLLLARWSARSRELAVRAAIGAGRARLVRQLLTETALLAAAGWALGIVLVAGCLRGFVYLAGSALPRLNELSADARVFGIALAVSLLTVLVFGVMPALRAGRVDIQTVLQHAARPGLSGGYRFARRALVAGEVALSLVLLSGAALLLETLWRMDHDRLGFVPEHLVQVSIPLPSGKASQRRALTEELLGEIRRIPGTEEASWSECTPLTGGAAGTVFTRSDRPLPKSWDRGDLVSLCVTGPDYFKAAGIRLIRGRYFHAADYDHPRSVVIVNEALARRYFPGEDPIGRQVDGGTNGGWKTVVGIVADSKNHGLAEPPTPQLFYNDWNTYCASPCVAFVVRHVGSTQMLAESVRAKVREIDPAMLAKFETLDDAIGRMSAPSRFNGVLVGSFAAVAFLMSAIGVYGVLAFAVAQRTQEIGIRMALGAGPAQVQAAVLKEGMLLTGAGTLLGLAGSLAAGRFLKTLLYGVTATDLPTYAAVIAAIAVTAIIAAWLPSRRAATVDPMVALRLD